MYNLEGNSAGTRMHLPKDTKHSCKSYYDTEFRQKLPRIPYCEISRLVVSILFHIFNYTSYVYNFSIFSGSHSTVFNTTGVRSYGS